MEVTDISKLNEIVPNEEVVEPESKTSFLRHSAWLPYNLLHQTITFVGVGAVGSNLAKILAKHGFRNFVLWDHDTVAAHNIPNQAFYERHIGMTKVEALQEVLKDVNKDVSVELHHEKCTSESPLEGWVILAPDSMAARSEIFENAINQPLVTRILEVRLGWDNGIIHVVDPNNENQIKRFKQSIIPDADLAEGMCNKKICPSVVEMFCAQSAHYIADCIARTIIEPDKIHDLPFRTHFSFNPSVVVMVFK